MDIIELARILNLEPHQAPLNIADKDNWLYLGTILRNCVFEEF